MNKVAEAHDFWSLEAYYWYYPEERCFETLAAQFGMTTWGYLLCDPYDAFDDDNNVAYLESYKFCMPDTTDYDVYTNQEGCSQSFTLGTGKLQPDKVKFGPTGDGEQNAINILET